MTVKPMPIDEIQDSAIMLAELLRAALEAEGASVPDSASPGDVLRAAERELKSENRRVATLYWCLYALVTIVIQNQLRAEMRARVGAWADVAFSQEDDEIGDEIRELVVQYLALKDRVLKRQQARMDMAKRVWAVGTEVAGQTITPIVEVERKYRKGLAVLVELLGEFDASIGTSPRTVGQWSKWQVHLEVGLHEGGVRDAEIAKIFGRSSTQSVANARSRYRKAAVPQPT